MMTKINELLDLTDVDCSKIISEIEKNILIDRENGIIQDEISVDYLKNKINEISQMTSLDYIYPLFIAKGYTKKEAILSQGVDGFTNLTTMSRVFTIMFSAVVSNAKVYYNQNSIQDLFEWVIYYLYFISSNIIDNKTNAPQQNINPEYHSSSKRELDKGNSIYNYELENEYLRDYLKINHSDKISFENRISRSNPYKKDDLIQSCIKEGSLSNYDIVKSETLKYCRLQTKSNYKFVKHFSTSNITSSFDEKNDFTFALFENDKLYIDVWLLEYTISTLNTFILWGHYKKLYNDLYNEKTLSEFAKISKKFNKLLTHYIADVLESNGYLLPYNGQKYPTIDIKKIKKFKLYGDIDILAYSPKTNTILNIEYKNYQMSLSNEKFYDSEVKRVEDDDIFNKIEKRCNQISENINIVKEYLSIKETSTPHIKNYLISTRVNYSCFDNNQPNVTHFTAYDFIKLIKDGKI